MFDLSQTSVEYVCKNVTSPNIARRFGHKLSDAGGVERCMRATSQAPILRSTANKDFSHRPRSSAASYDSSYISTSQRFYRGQVKSFTDEDSAIFSPTRSNSPNTDRALTHRVNSWLKDPSRAVLPSTGIKSKLSEIPKIFVYHQSTLKTYLRSWQ
eukprot:GFUD01070022.1.p1 GENE.GFUD01070022.1~~GFUD01070022.1.p1  ORF type:complete len:169 (-),score=36.82 GFUD01070022.1:24-491(-)